MTQKIVIGPIDRGLRTDRTAFVIDNDSFPTLINAYQWRGRVKRKRGTEFLGRLRRFFNSLSVSYSSTTTINLVAGSANLLTGFSLQANGNIVPGSVTIIDSTNGNTYTDPSMDGTLVGAPAGSGTINYATGVITIAGGVVDTISASFLYYPDLPVLGLEDFVIRSNAFPFTIGFDTTYSYNISTFTPYSIYDVSFYKNPPTGTYPGYIQKTNPTPTTWNGQDYQQFWTVNYQGALWATNGINVPFSAVNIGMQYKFITAVAIVAAGPPAIATLTIAAHGLVVGDFVFINEIVGMTGINFETGYVIAIVNANQVNVEFPNATLGGAYASGGIAQYLTNRSDITKDSLRWYDGDPTNGNPTTPGFSAGMGWVNFAPPLSLLSFSIADLPAAKYYLVGARMIVPFKDRLLFFGPVVQTSSAGSQIYLQDTVIFSQNGTPYYTASFTYVPPASTDPTLPTIIFNPILVPINQTATAPAYFEDVTGFGGFLTAGVDSPIISTGFNEDVIIVGFDDSLQTRLVYTGNDIIPFNFFSINVEYGTSSTFSSIDMDKGVISRGNKGFITANQVQVLRIDSDILDQVFEISLQNNGTERVTAHRDFINEWIYFTYLSNKSTYKFPNQTLQFNYRDGSWAIFDECYTHYGAFKRQSGFTWSTVGNTFPTWASWNQAWEDGESTLLQPDIIAGNQQGFVLFRADGTEEGNSLYIQGFAASVVTSPDHCLNEGDYIIISGVIGTIGTQVNGKIFSVSNTTQNTFMLNPGASIGTYFGGGIIKRMYVPFIQTKQFPVVWADARKTRLGAQRYLLTKTSNSQMTLLVFLSQNSSSAYNQGAIIPDPASINSGLVYSTTLYTCPESTNLGLTPANINLQTPTSSDQEQLWHRVSTSLIGDTVQLGFTLSDKQMRLVNDDGLTISQFSEIELHSIILDVTPSQMLV